MNHGDKLTNLRGFDKATITVKVKGKEQSSTVDLAQIVTDVQEHGRAPTVITDMSNWVLCSWYWPAERLGLAPQYLPCRLVLRRA